MVGVAVKVTFVPAQIVLPGAAAMVTDGVALAVTVMLIGLATVVQPVAVFFPVNVPLNVVVVTTVGIPVIGIGETGKPVRATSGGPEAQSIEY